MLLARERQSLPPLILSLDVELWGLRIVSEDSVWEDESGSILVAARIDRSAMIIAVLKAKIIDPICSHLGQTTGHSMEVVFYVHHSVGSNVRHTSRVVV